MPPELEPFKWWLSAIGYTTFAAVGGLLSYLLRSLDRGESVRFRAALVQAGCAGFAGLLILFVCNALGLSEEWKGVVVGVAGWLGADATIQMLSEAVRKKLGIENRPSREKQNDLDNS